MELVLERNAYYGEDDGKRDRVSLKIIFFRRNSFSHRKIKYSEGHGGTPG